MAKPLKIMVVDNDPAILTYVSMILGREGCEVVTAEDGLAALKKLEDWAPDVMFIDLIMPNISGEKLCAIVRSTERLRDVFLVLLSAISAEEYARYIDYGFDATIAKGPLRATGEYVLDILNRLSDGSLSRSQHLALGLEGLHKREITKELLSTREHYELILGNMSEGILEVARDGRVVYANPAVTALLEVPETRLLGSPFIALFTGLDRESVLRCLKEGGSCPQGVGPVSLAGRRVALTLLSLEDNGEQSIIVILDDVTDRLNAQDQLQRAHDELEQRVHARTAELSELNERLAAEIAERTRAEARIKASLDEKELLLREVHHRVKNNLQIISSLVKLPLRNSQDKNVVDLVQETQNRIRSIWLIHEKLYRSKDLSVVDFSEYVHTLAQHLFDSYSVDRSRIGLRVECDPVRLDVDRAIPCGLILNEVVSNALRHAFPDGRSGVVNVRLQRITARRCRMVISDNGVGIGDAGIAPGSRTLGMRIVDSLSRQIDAAVQISSVGGTTFTITFPTSAARAAAEP